MNFKKILLTLILAPKLALACEMSRALAETQFVVDSEKKLTTLESIKNNSQVEIERCTFETKYLLVNINSLYFQDDTSRQESVGGNLIDRVSNCSIQSEVPFQRMNSENLALDVKNKHKFLRSCVKLVIADAKGMKVNVHPKSSCQYKAINEFGSAIETDGAGCFIAVNPSSKIVMETKINPDCLEESFLSANQIQAGDYESVIKVWPAAMSATDMSLAPPIGARYVRHTLLPIKGFMPRAVKEDMQHPSFISAITTNIIPGNISVMSMGSERYQIQPTFLVENMAKNFCKGDQCGRVSSFVTPIAGVLNLTKINEKTGRRQHIGEWSHALKVPANWSGMAEFKSENNMSGLSMGALEADMTMKPGDIFELSAKFYEPRALLDELLQTHNYFELNNDLSVGADVDESLPTLPQAGRLGQLDKMPKMPSIGLGHKGILDLIDQLNMKRAWSQKYDRLCDSQNLNCMKLEGLNKPIALIKMVFKVGENQEIIPVLVTKKSDVFESYEQAVASFAKKVCQ